MPNVSPISNSVNWAIEKGGLEKVMISVALSLKVLGEDGATRDEVVIGGFSTTSSPDSKGGKDTPSLHK